VSFASIRRDYLGVPLDDGVAPSDPLRLFLDWFDEIRPLEPDPTAMALATVGADGRPSARMVLLKDVNAHGLTFFTNFESRKGRELAANPHASLLFYWRSLERQVRIEGAVSRVADAESDDYFATRPVESRWSACASAQSRTVISRAVLEAQVAAVRERFGEQVPRPASWGGFRLSPDAFEFWQGRPNRLHDRLRYDRADDGAWRHARLAP
jgi:pyridoxamine 5'-phosphate oxidase